MSVSALLGNPKPQFFISGLPAVGYRLFFYDASTSTKHDTYTDSTAVTVNTNPIVLDAEGYPTGNVMIYGTDNVAHKVIMAPPGSDDPPTSTTWSIDKIYTTASGLVQVGTTVVNFTAVAGQTLFSLPAGTSYGLGNNSLQVFLGNGVAGGRSRLTKDQDYTETTVSTFTLTYGAVANDYVTAVIGQVLPSPSTVAGSSVILTSGDSIQDYVSHQTINIKDAPYSAAGDGITDDTAAIQAALDHLAAVGGGELIGENVTTIVTQLNVNNMSNIIIRGKNWIIKQKDNSVGATLTNFRGTLYGDTGVSKITIIGIEFNGNKSGNGGTANIATYRQSCLYLGGDDLLIKECIAHDATDSGIVVLGGTRNTVINNKSYDNYLLGFRFGSYPALGLTYSTLQDNKASDNCIPNNDYTATFTTLTPDGYIIENCTYCEISNIHGYYTGTHVDTSQAGSGIKVYECYYNNFKGINANNCPWQGLHVENSDYNTFANIVSNNNGMTVVAAGAGTGNGLYVLNSNDNVFDGGICLNNTRDTNEGHGVHILSSGVLTSNRNKIKSFKLKGSSYAGAKIFQNTGNEDNEFINCSFLGNNVYGLYIRANRTTVDGCLFTAEIYGCYLGEDNTSTQTTDHTIINNRFYNNTYALRVYTTNPNGLNSSLGANKFSGNTNDYSGFSNLTADLMRNSGYMTDAWGALADDTAVSYTMRSLRGFVFVSTQHGEYAVVWCNYNSLVSIHTGGLMDVNLTNGTLTGTTGTDTHMTVRVNNGVFYIENRLGSATKTTLTLLG